MGDSQSSTAVSNEKLYKIDWNLPDRQLIVQMNGLIEALKNKEDGVANSLLQYTGGCSPSIHIFGMDGNNRCHPEVVSTWLSLLVTLASLEDVTGESIASLFPKSCGGCMVYSIVMLVGCFHSKQNIQLAFDFFRHVLADPNGEILELDEVSQLSSLLAQNIPARSDGTYMRMVCLELHCYERIWDMNDGTKRILEKLRHLIEGLGVLCTSKSFLHAMKTNRTATLSTLKASIMNNTFSYDSAGKIGINCQQK